MRRIALVLAALLVGSILPSATAGAQDAGTGSDNITHISTLEFPDIFGLGAEGTDSDFVEMTVPGSTELRQVGVFGSIGSGAKILDVTDGEPVELAFYPCSIGQGDVQIFQRDEARGTATYFTYADDGYSRRTLSPENKAIYGEDCLTWAQREVPGQLIAGGSQGTYIIDITDPRDPQPVNFVPFRRGTHNQTVHPSGNYLYNSNSELITNIVNAGIEVFDITDLAAPVSLGVLPLPKRPGLGTDSHDITFNAEGTRAYSAALSQTVIIDTTDPAAPSVISSFMDPQINVEHQANLVQMDDPILGERDFLIVEDEFAGAAGAELTCPSGGVHIYDVTGPLENAPVKVGYWNISDIMVTDILGSCTAHVFEIYEDAGIMTMSFYNGGIRVVDIRSLIGLSTGDTAVTGMREIGFHYFDDSNSWSVKAADIQVGENGELDFFLYSDDINRGVDVYRFTGNINDAGTGNDVFLNAVEAAAQLPMASLPLDYTPFCLIGTGGEQSADEAGAVKILGS